MSKTDYIKKNVEELHKTNTFKELKTVTGECKNRIVLNGVSDIVNMSSNNYLGLANLEVVKQAAIDAVNKYGAGAGAVRVIVGNYDLIDILEDKIARFKHEEAVICFQSGFNANIGTIPAITSKGDLIVSDELNHASIIDGIRLSKADKAIFKHSDLEDLERVLKEHRSEYNNVLIITDGVFSMDGDIALLPGIVELAKKYDCLTYVDDAHGSGVLGKSGRGTVDHYNLHGQIDFIMGTLSKAIGVVGGYIACKQEVKDWLINRGRPLLFSTALPPAATGATIKSIELLSESEEYTAKLWNNAIYFKKRVSELGFDIGHSETPITPVMIKSESATIAFSEELIKEKVFVSPILFPTVPKNTARLRVMVSAMHTKEDLDYAISKFKQIGQKLNLI